MSLPIVEDAAAHSARRWNPVLGRAHYTFGYHGCSFTGGGQEARDELFTAYAVRLHDTFRDLFDLPVREAWVEANEIVEGAGVQWAYQRTSGQGADAYDERLRGQEPTDPAPATAFFTARGTC